MGVDYVDVFYHHRNDPDTPLEETMGALDQAVRSGKALYAGISSYSAERTAEAAARSCASSGTPLFIHQPSYSLLNRWVEGGLLDTAAEVGRRRDRVLPAGARDADRPLPRRHSGRLADGRELLAVGGAADRAEPGTTSGR